MSAAANPVRLPISCFILAKNEADRLARTIRSVAGWVDEIIVIDSGSTDGTQAIAQAEGARVVFNPWNGFGQQKRFGEDQCRHHWILNIDADEVVTDAMKRAILALFAHGTPPLAGYGTEINIIYPGWTKPRPFAKDHYAVRLYDRRRVRFKNSTLFDRIDAKDETMGRLDGGLDHYSVRSFDDLIRKSDERATYNALHSEPRSMLELTLRLLFEFPANFLKYYFVRTHILGGWTGLRYAWIVSYYRWMRIVRLRERMKSGT